MRILVTGGAGFIGSNFVHHMVKRHPGYEIVVVDSLTYAGNLSNLGEVSEEIAFIRGDICDERLIDEIVDGCDTIVHFAAESHVDRSISDPGPFLRTNILGTEVLLRMALKHGVGRFHHVSTDEVFGSLPLGQGSFNELSPYNPRSPYSASKAASDHLVRAYGETYGLSYTITNCSNNYGQFQDTEKVIPRFITNAILGKKLPVYGDGLCVRDYLNVWDHCRAIDKVLHEGQSGKTYCVGGGTELNGIEISTTILDRMNLPHSMIEFVVDRLGHDRRYAIDSSLIKQELKWEPIIPFDLGIDLTINWYISNQNWWRDK